MKDSFVVGSRKQRKLVWKLEDKQFLKNNYRSMSLEELAESLGKTVTQVKNQAQRQYLTKRGK